MTALTVHGSGLPEGKSERMEKVLKEIRGNLVLAMNEQRKIAVNALGKHLKTEALGLAQGMERQLARIDWALGRESLSLDEQRAVSNGVMDAIFNGDKK